MEACHKIRVPSIQHDGNIKLSTTKFIDLFNDKLEDEIYSLHRSTTTLQL